MKSKKRFNSLDTGDGEISDFELLEPGMMVEVGVKGSQSPGGGNAWPTIKSHHGDYVVVKFSKEDQRRHNVRPTARVRASQIFDHDPIEGSATGIGGKVLMGAVLVGAVFLGVKLLS